MFAFFFFSHLLEALLLFCLLGSPFLLIATGGKYKILLSWCYFNLYEICVGKPWTKVGDILFDHAVISVCHTDTVKMIPGKKEWIARSLRRGCSPMETGLTADSLPHKGRASTHQANSLVYPHSQL